MFLKAIIENDLVNYGGHNSMFIGFPSCTFKCEIECGQKCCQNSELVKSPNVEISIDKIVEKYLNNNLSSAIVCGGLEPFDTFKDLLDTVAHFRKVTDDDIVIYTGYYPEEIEEQLTQLKAYTNIIVKFGRFIPNHPPRFDEILGVELASDNQYAESVS